MLSILGFLMRLMWDVDVGLTQEGEAGGVSGAQLVGREGGSSRLLL